MAIIETVTLSRFIDGFSIRPNNFSYEGLRALYDHFDDMDGDVEYAPICICCEWTEYDTMEEAIAEYDGVESAEDLRDEHYVIELDGWGVLVVD